MTITPTPWFVTLITDTHGAKIESSVTKQIVAMVYDARDADFIVAALERPQQEELDELQEQLEKEEAKNDKLEAQLEQLEEDYYKLQTALDEMKEKYSGNN